jgi:hypothetical protein
VTLYELATGTLPKWGDGKTDPSHLDSEITIDAELFDASIRDGLNEFFQMAFRRDTQERFDNAEEMLRTWRDCFEGIEQPGTLSDHENEAELSELLADVDIDTRVSELGLSTRIVDALDRTNVLTVKDLLTMPLQRLVSMRGVGNKTRREIGMAIKILRDRLGQSQPEDGTTVEVDTGTQAEQIDTGNLSVDLLAQRVIRVGPKEDETVRRVLHMLLGLDPELKDSWPSQADVAHTLHIARAQVGQLISKFLTRWSREPGITKLRGDIAVIIESAGGIISLPDLAVAILVARGSGQDEPRRTQLAIAVARVCVEVERMKDKPQFLVRRDRDRVLVALRQELADYASRLGDEADILADEDPLVPPARVIQRLRDIPLPLGAVELTDSRLVRLAAVASQHAAVSSRQELYPRGMDAARALKLSQGALYGVRFLTVQQIRERVSSRYPEAASLPERPALDDLLHAAGFDFQWDAVAEATGRYVSRAHEADSISSGSDSISGTPTAVMPHAGKEITPEIADARQFEERLQRGIRDGSFLALLVNPKYYQQAYQELCTRFPLQLVNFVGLFIDALHQVADRAKVKWELVLKTDSTPHEGDWDRLMLLVRRTMPLIEEQLTKADKPMLMVYASLLARYDQMALLERLRDKVGRRDGIPGLWVLIPGDQHAVMDGKALPIISAGQRVRIPERWIKGEGLTRRREDAE